MLLPLLHCSPPVGAVYERAGMRAIRVITRTLQEKPQSLEMDGSNDL